MDKISPENTHKSEDSRQALKKIKSKERKLRPKSTSKCTDPISICNQTCKSLKTHSNPSVIEKILQKSLTQAKNRKIPQKKDLKLKLLKNELRKHELENNKKVKLNHSLSIKYKRPKSKENIKKLTNLGIAKIEDSPKVKNIDSALLVSKKHKKKFSLDRLRKDPKFFDSIRKKKSQLSCPESIRTQKSVKAKKIANNLLKTLKKLPENSFSSLQSHSFTYNPKKSSTLHNVKKNISFIYEDHNEKPFTKEENIFTEKDKINKTFESNSKFTETLEDDRKSTDFMYKPQKSREFNTIEYEFPVFLQIEPQTSLQILSQRPKSLTLTTTSGPNTQPISKFLHLSSQNNTQISPTHKSVQNSAVQTTFNTKTSTESIFSLKPHKKQMKITKNSVFSIKSQPCHVSLEQYSWNLALLFLIDQLHLYEISDITEAFPSVTSATLQKFGKKYVGIKNFLQNSFEKSSSSLVESLNFDQNTQFIHKTHKKKIEIQKVLTEIFEECLEMNEDSETSEMIKNESFQFLHEELEKSKILEKGIKGKKENEFGFSISDRNPKRIMDSAGLKVFLEMTFQLLNWPKIVRDLKSPLVKNPLEELDKLQDTQIGSLTETEIRNFPQLFETAHILNSLSLEPHQKIHQTMLLEVLNYLLQQFRPFKYKGHPLPWSYFSFINKPLSVFEIKKKILNDFLVLESVQIGSLLEIDSKMKNLSEKALVKMKEAQIDKILFAEALVEEKLWLDYEFEETQVKVDMGDLILQDLVLEVIKCFEC